MSPSPTAPERQAKAGDEQHRAVRPTGSAWVSASAGTGKTTVLTDRVLSLLLAGTDPARILCLTFTKAAAAEMANRLAARLATWASGEEQTVAKDLAGLRGAPVDLDRVRTARRLFARVLDTPGGMRIQTIHAFCQSVLSRFPLEAGVAPHFQVLDERTAAELLERARREILAGPEAGPVAGAVAEVSAHLHEQSFAQLVNELIGERGRLMRLVRERGGVEAVIAAVYERLGAAPETTVEEVRQAGVVDEALDRFGLELVVEALASGTGPEQAKAQTLRGWLALSPAGRVARLANYRALFLTQEGEPRKEMLYKAAKAAVPGAEEVMLAEAERLRALEAAANAQAVAHGTTALVRLGAGILETYTRHKQARALLDYDDLIYAVRDLLGMPGVAPWVLFKLDGGIEHVLVDEAQDTNPEQWQVIQALSEEFFAGEGAHEAPRTVFAVGDPKQSIFSFQRARPEAFEDMRGYFAERVRRARQDWAEVDLERSYRSTAAVLQAVDAVFARPEAQDGVLFGRPALHHEPVREGQAGLVELWPPAAPEDPDTPEPWAPPVAPQGARPARTRLAELIAARIWRWTLDPAGAEDPEAWLDSQNRRLVPGDFMVLVRRRNEFVEELVRALKQRGVPVSGVDRMVLTDQLAVMDLVALGRVLLLPEDDLTLATVLKGPLFGFSEEELFELAHGRGGTLWDALAARAERDAACRAAYGELTDLRGRADYLRPFELFAEILGPRGARRRLAARLGPDALDPIEEFLSFAIAYERESIPSLEGFLHWLEAGQQEVKRDLEHGTGAVRVMTVHGAKGLQAPVVILPDTLQIPTRGPGLYWLGADDGEAVTAPLPLWPIRKAYDGEAAATARAGQAAARDREYRRLLYVAMTRAEDRLYLCGWHTRQNPPESCWYKLAERALTEVAEPAAFDFTELVPGGWSGPGWRLRCPQTAAPERERAAEAAPAAPSPPPAWASAPAPPEPDEGRPLAPSRPAEEEPPPRSPLGPDKGERFRRGRIIHRLLESLPDLPAERRPAAGRRFLARPVLALPPDEREAILDETLAVMAHAEAAPLFAPGSLAEAPIVGRLEGAGGPRVVSGQIDRLALAPDRVLLVDYKSGRPPPERDSEIPSLYLRQMAGYRALLAQVYPGRSVECFLLWTEGPRLVQLSPDLLAGHAP